MMNQNEYLSEENYQKANKKVKTAGIIILLIGLSMLGFGVYTIITAKSMSVPNMGEPNWFEMSSAQSDKEFTGTALCIFGFFITFVGCIVRFFIGNARNIMAYQTQQMRPIAQESAEKMAPTAGVVAKEVAKGFKSGFKDE